MRDVMHVSWRSGNPHTNLVRNAETCELSVGATALEKILTVAEGMGRCFSG